MRLARLASRQAGNAAAAAAMTAQGDLSGHLAGRRIRHRRRGTGGAFEERAIAPVLNGGLHRVALTFCWLPPILVPLLRTMA